MSGESTLPHEPNEGTGKDDEISPINEIGPRTKSDEERQREKKRKRKNKKKEERQKEKQRKKVKKRKRQRERKKNLRTTRGMICRVELSK